MSATTIRTAVIAIASTTLLSVTGCQTKTTSARFQAAQSDIQACYKTIAAAQSKQAVPTFKDDRDMLVFLVIQKLTQANPYAHCDDAYIAMISADQAKTSNVAGIVKTGVGMGLGLIGLDILTNGLTRGSSTTGDTWNVEGSRINSKATASGGSTISSSGTGMGLGNTYGQAQGGIEPRQWQIQQSPVTEINTQSQSGDNAPDTPLEAPGDVTIAPVEE